MKKIFFGLILVLSFNWLNAQDDEDKVIKQGWNFGILPFLTYDIDLGLQYGGVINLFDYGDGSRYPDYDHSLFFEISKYTKGSGIYRFYYDSDRLFKGLIFTMDLSYLTDMAYDFYGFNGYNAVFTPGWIDEGSDDYISRVYYKYDRKLFRWKSDIQGNINSDRWRWLAGANLLNFDVGPVNLNKLNKGKSGDEILPEVDGLYDNYLEWGILNAKEADGGFVPTFKTGIVYDTRDNEPNPMKGIWTEAVVLVSPKILGAESSFAKFNLTHRQYFTLIPKKLSFAYRLLYQTTIAGEVPFYYQTQIITSVLKGSTSEGLGGSKTIRGMKRNRVVGDGVFLGNTELRWKFARFNLLNNNFYLGLNAFLDFGRVVDKIEFSASLPPSMSPMEYSNYFEDNAEKMHYAFGSGLRIAMNRNFIVAIDYGLALDERDGTSGLYMGMNYLF